MSRFITNAAHSPGFTCVAFNSDGKLVLTGGDDCTARLWKVDQGNDQEPDTSTEPDQPVTSIAVTRECWLSASADSQVRRHVKDSGQIEGIITSSQAVPVRCLAVDSRQKRIAVSSDELEVKIIDLDDTEKIIFLEKQHERGVRKVTWHPKLDLVATSSSDGKIIMWDVSEEEPKVEKVLEGVIPKVVDTEALEFNYDCSAVWHPSGDKFYVASRTHEICQISRGSWLSTKPFTDKEVGAGPVTALAISPNGLYLASACRGKLFVWSTLKNSIVARQLDGTSPIIQIAFSPTQNVLAWTDMEGNLLRWFDPIPANLPDPVKPSSLISLRSNKEDILDELLADEPMGPAGEDDDTYLNGDADREDDFIDDDLGLLAGRDKIPPNEPSFGNDRFVKEMVSITKAQPPFQPGSTPMEGKKRYLAYNMIGVIEVTDQDTRNLVTVDFFNRSLRSSYNFVDHLRFDMAYLGERGALFACPPEPASSDDESGHPAQVLYKPYAPLGRSHSDLDWRYVLNRPGTRVLGVAAGGVAPSSSSDKLASDEVVGYGNIVVATSENDLTFLSGSGRERRVIGLAGDFVSMVASSEWVFVIYRAGSTTIDGSQNLSYVLINFEDYTVRQRDVLPLPKGHTLSWIGTSQEGAPLIYDSAGRLHILNKHRIPHHASWVRLLDTNLLERKEGKDESYWPVGLSGDTFMCLILKGRQEHPGFPRPLVQELPVRLPFRDASDQEEKLEREGFHLEQALDALGEELTTDDILSRERAMDKEFIQLIQAACKATNAARAIELVKLLHMNNSFAHASKIADFYHMTGLKERIELIKATREENEDIHVIAREKRQRWTKPDAPRRLTESNDVAPSTHSKPFQAFGPPAPISRPGLSRATPIVVEPTQFTSVTPSTVAATQLDPSFDEESMTTESPPGSKRKRDAIDVSTQDSFAPASKQKINPFARKPAQDNNRNPFARKADTNRVLQKSESFFDKVDSAVEMETVRKRPTKKDKDKKDGPRQTTLFGLLAPKDSDNKARPKKSNVEESQDTQEDVDMGDSGEEQGGDTQPADESQMADAPIEDTQAIDTDFVVENDSQISVST